MKDNRYHVLGKRDKDFYYNHIESTRFYIIGLIIALINRRKYDKVEIRREGYIWKWDGNKRVI